MDTIISVDEATPSTERMRCGLHCGQVMQRLVLHVFHFVSPDLLFGIQGPTGKHKIFEPLEQQPELGRREVTMRKFRQATVGTMGHWRK